MNACEPVAKISSSQESSPRVVRSVRVDISTASTDSSRRTVTPCW
jgi:hypothetical protein